jgi:nucleoside 2-deoxyribosyltransferase
MKAFVIMPFAKEFDDIFKIGIKETAKKSNINAYRLDEELFDEGMLDKIYNEIENCDFIIADLSDKNPNVFYELGYAHAIGKLCILITQSAENIPFDLKHKRHIVYGNSIVHLKEQLTKNFEWAKKEIESNKSNPFEIELKTDGSLEKTDEYAEATINFMIDIENKSNKVSPEIQAIYLYSSRMWNLKQHGKNLSYKKSDLKPYSYKYQLSTDTSKIPKKGWTQIELVTTRIIAQSWEGEEIKDSYTIQGNVFIEIATDKGNFSKKIPISVYVDTLPF